MQLVYYLVFIPLYLFSLLPLRVLYIFSWVLNLLLFRIGSYRHDVVRKNLVHSFPEKRDEEIAQLHRAFNKYFCDLIVETIKTLSISAKRLETYIKFDNLALFEKYYQEGKSVIIVLGHHGNWELIGAGFAPLPLHELYVIYHPLKNKVFDQLLFHMRTRLGNKLYTMKGTMRGMIGNRAKTTATAFIADQTPSPDRAYWTTFLNQDTPIFTGTEKIAQRLDYPVIYMSIRRPKRGLYRVQAKLLTDQPKEMHINAISELHTRSLEADIRAQPEIWLWTHRRWKHKRPTSN